MGKTYLHAVASLDGYIADERDDVGPLHDWYFNGDHPLVDEDHADVHGAPFRVSAASADYVRGMWSRQQVLVIGRHQFDLTDGWEGHPPAGDHVVVVSHRPRPAGRRCRWGSSTTWRSTSCRSSSAGGSRTSGRSRTVTWCSRIPRWSSTATGCSICVIRCIGDAGCHP